MSIKFNDQKSLISVRIPDKIKKALDRIARANDESFSELINECIICFLDNNYCPGCQRKLMDCVDDHPETQEQKPE